MARTIALRLGEKARGAYVVAIEPEVANRKRTDIRLFTVRGDHKAAIEVKIADAWSLAELELALREQLVEQYLRHENGRAGCLLLTFHRQERRWRHPETGAHLTDREVVERLGEQARSIEREFGGDVRVAVFDLDLTDTRAL